MNKKIYIVEGRCGCYSDYREWPVKAFLKKANADSLAKKLQQAIYDNTSSDVNRLKAINDLGDDIEFLSESDVEYAVYSIEIADYALENKTN